MPTAITVPGRPRRQDGEIVEQAAPANIRAQIEIGDGRADDQRDRRGCSCELELLMMPRTETWSKNNAVPKCASVKLESDRGSVQLLENAVRTSTPTGAMALKNTTVRQNIRRGQRQPPSEIRLGTHAASAHSHIGTPVEVTALQRKPDHSEHDQHKRQRRCLPPARWIAADGRVNARGQKNDLRGHPDDRLRPEQGERVDRRQKRAARDRGRDQRQVHAQRGLPAARTEDLR